MLVNVYVKHYSCKYLIFNVFNYFDYAEQIDTFCMSDISTHSSLHPFLLPGRRCVLKKPGYCSTPITSAFFLQPLKMPVLAEKEWLWVEFLPFSQ